MPGYLGIRAIYGRPAWAVCALVALALAAAAVALALALALARPGRHGRGCMAGAAAAAPWHRGGVLAWPGVLAPPGLVA